MNTQRHAHAQLSAVLGVVILVLAGMLLSAGVARAESLPKLLADPTKPEGNAVCLECHSKPDHMTRAGKDISIQIDAGAYENSVHGILSCVRCHEEAGKPEHLANPTKPLEIPTAGTRERMTFQSAQCVKCHAGVYEESYNLSFHGVAVQHGDTRAATCADCHGIHSILPSRNPASPIAPDQVAKTCGQSGCHQNVPANFGAGKEHVVPAKPETSSGLHIVYQFFMGLIMFDVMKDGPIVMFELLRRLQH